MKIDSGFGMFAECKEIGNNAPCYLSRDIFVIQANPMMRNGLLLWIFCQVSNCKASAWRSGEQLLMEITLHLLCPDAFHELMHEMKVLLLCMKMCTDVPAKPHEALI